MDRDIVVSINKKLNKNLIVKVELSVAKMTPPIGFVSTPNSKDRKISNFEVKIEPVRCDIGSSFRTTKN